MINEVVPEYNVSGMQWYGGVVIDFNISAKLKARTDFNAKRIRNPFFSKVHGQTYGFSRQQTGLLNWKL